MAGVTPRALHHYDRIGLLRPSARGPNGYRLYERGDLQRLQQILFYRELDVPLDAIGRLLDAEGFDAEASLLEHRRRLEKKFERIAALIETLDRTLADLEGEAPLLDVSELYDGFTREEAERFEAESESRWGGSRAYRESRASLRGMTKRRWLAIRQEGECREAALLSAFRSGESSDGASARQLVLSWIEYLGNYYSVDASLVRGLGELYSTDPAFRVRYEALEAGFADWLREAMEVASLDLVHRPKA